MFQLNDRVPRGEQLDRDAAAVARALLSPPDADDPRAAARGAGDIAAAQFARAALALVAALHAADALGQTSYPQLQVTNSNRAKNLQMIDSAGQIYN